VSAYGTYLVAEELGGSGVIAVVTTGLILGNFGSRIGMSPRTRLSVSEFWDFVAFFVNSIVFLLIGDQVVFDGLIDNLNTILIAIAVMILARAVSIFGLSAVSNWWGKSNIQLSNQVVLWWGGLRGSVSVALALSVPESLAEREDIIAIIFGVMLFTLLVQGLTTKPLLQFLNLLGDQPLRQAFIQKIARRVALNRVMDELKNVKKNNSVDAEYCDYQMALVEGQLEEIQEEMTVMQRDHPELSRIVIDRLNESLVAIEADTYAQFIRAGYLKEEIEPLLESLLEATEPEDKNVVEALQ
jgi:CPA1 family monovalent cation:H+ antiporter